MKSKRNMRTNKRKRRTSKRGGVLGYFGKKSQVDQSECEPNDLVNIKSSLEMHNKYQNCCPRSRLFRTKNSSPYCKQLELNFKHALRKEKLDEHGETDTFDKEIIANYKKRPRWFFGGKKTRKNIKPRK